MKYMGFGETTKKGGKQASSGFKNIGKFFKRKEKDQVINDHTNDAIETTEKVVEIKEEDKKIGIDNKTTELDVVTETTRPIEEPVKIEERKESIGPSTTTTDVTSETDNTPEESGTAEEVPENFESFTKQPEPRIKKSDEGFLASARLKRESEKKERENKMRQLAEEENQRREIAKKEADAARIDEIKEKLQKLLDVSTRIRIDFLQDYLQMDRGMFVHDLVDWAVEFNFTIDGDYIVPKFSVK